jgi:hypothetical protein
VAVEVLSPESGFTLTEDKKTLTLGLPPEAAPGRALTLGLTVANSADRSKTAEVSKTLMPVSGPLARPASGALVYYDGNGALGLKTGEGDTRWLCVTEPALQTLFNAIYTPNAPGAADTVESGKAALEYSAEISAAVLGLFTVTLGMTPAGDRVELGGTALPSAASGTIVIDLGLPGGGNEALPAFYIPDRGLGSPSGDYSHLRLRVNRGASLVIEADNSAYEGGGAGNPCPAGYFNGGCVEVMAGGRLRDGAYEGFPLGEGAVIIARLGSWLAVGPESSFSANTAGYAPGRDRYYSGWLLGPAGEDARLCWDPGDQNGSYLEIREGALAFDANITVKKSLSLSYSVWFINGPRLTIDAAGDGLSLSGRKGLFAQGSRRFYGTKSSSGGRNPGKPAAEIVLRPGSALSQSFLKGEGGFVEALNAGRSVKNAGNTGASGGEAPYAAYGDGSGRGGYLNWIIPAD